MKKALKVKGNWIVNNKRDKKFDISFPMSSENDIVFVSAKFFSELIELLGNHQACNVSTEIVEEDESGNQTKMQSINIKTIHTADGSVEINAYRSSDNGFVYGVSLVGQNLTEEAIAGHVVSVQKTAESIVNGTTAGGPQLLVE